ncbi:hypothetical protein D3C80_1562930 [compost metagenome]
MKRQHQHADGVVPVQPGTLPLARAEGEELLEDLLVGNDAGDQPQQHDESAERREPTANRVRHLKLEVKAVEELTTAAVTCFHRLAGLGIEGFPDKATRAATGVAVAHTQGGLPFVRHANEPGTRMPCIVLQVTLSDCQAIDRVQGMAAHFRLRPMSDFFLEVRQRAGKEDGEQQPAEDQAGPGVQPGHGLAEAFFHGFFIQ